MIKAFTLSVAELDAQDRKAAQYAQTRTRKETDMKATSSYLNAEPRTIEQVMESDARAKYVKRFPDVPPLEINEKFRQSQEFRDYRLAYRNKVNRPWPTTSLPLNA